MLTKANRLMRLILNQFRYIDREMQPDQNKKSGQAELKFA
jgi:hypothetical protein